MGVEEALEKWRKTTCEEAFRAGYFMALKDNTWKQAVEEACIVSHLSFAGNPREVLSRLIGWEVKLALDPAVSKEAQNLIDRGYKKERDQGRRESDYKRTVAMSMNEQDKQLDVCYACVECVQMFKDMSPIIKEPAMEMLRTELNPVIDQIKAAYDAAPDNWYVPYHFNWGMAVRNLLREKGFGEDYFKIHNLDDIYIALVEEALGLNHASSESEKEAQDLVDSGYTRRESITRIARQAEELGDYDKFIPPESEDVPF